MGTLHSGISIPSKMQLSVFHCSSHLVTEESLEKSTSFVIQVSQITFLGLSIITAFPPVQMLPLSLTEKELRSLISRSVLCSILRLNLNCVYRVSCTQVLRKCQLNETFLSPFFCPHPSDTGYDGKTESQSWSLLP